MKRILVSLITCVATLGMISPGVKGQTWDPNKVYDAMVGGSPNTLRYIDNNGSGFVGWAVNDTLGGITNTPPSAPNLIGGMYGNYFQVYGDASTGGKEKHVTSNWTLDGAATTRTALFWRIYIPSGPTPFIKFPSIQIRTHNLRHHLDFDPNVQAGDGCIGFVGGWVDAEGATINSGGRLVLNGGGRRYLPMSMDQWHTIRVEVTAGGHYEAWIDEDQGLTDVQHVSCTATKTGSGDYIEIGVRSTIKGGYSHYYTNYLVFGQDTTATGGTNQIKPLPTAGVEICGNGLDDNLDGLTDCQDPGCLCDERPEICGNGVDDDCDGLADCADPDCLDVNPENNETTCSNGIDEDCDGLYDCSDPDCAAVAHCANDQPYYALTLVRQVGNWQSAAQYVYFSVYDENGTPLNDVVLKDAIGGCTTTTHKDTGSTYGQDGHTRTGGGSTCPDWPTSDYRFYVSQDPILGPGVKVASDVTPDLHNSLPWSPRYSWQVEFMRISRRDNPVSFTPLEPTYIFDSVEMNPPSGANDTLMDDESGLGHDSNVPPGVAFGQTFVATGNRVVSLRAEVTNGWPDGTQGELQYRARIFGPLTVDPPQTINDIGPQVGPERLGPVAMKESEWWRQMMVWPVNDSDPANMVVVEPGQKYMLVVDRVDTDGPVYPYFTAFGSKDWYDGLGMKHSGDRYPYGERYRLDADGVTLVTDIDAAEWRGLYDMTAYIVSATVSDNNPCRFHDPVFDMVGGQDDQGDGMVDSADFIFFESCATGPGISVELDPLCKCVDHNGDDAIDQLDFAAFQLCFSGIAQADKTCDD